MRPGSLYWRTRLAAQALVRITAYWLESLGLAVLLAALLAFFVCRSDGEETLRQASSFLAHYLAASPRERVGVDGFILAAVGTLTAIIAFARWRAAPSTAVKASLIAALEAEGALVTWTRERRRGVR